MFSDQERERSEEIQALQAEMQELNEAMEGFKATQARVLAEQVALQEQINGLEAEPSGRTSRSEELETLKRELYRKLSELEGELLTVRDQVLELAPRLSQVEARISEVVEAEQMEESESESDQESELGSDSDDEMHVPTPAPTMAPTPPSETIEPHVEDEEATAELLKSQKELTEDDFEKLVSELSDKFSKILALSEDEQKAALDSLTVEELNLLIAIGDLRLAELDKSAIAEELNLLMPAVGILFAELEESSNPTPTAAPVEAPTMEFSEPPSEVLAAQAPTIDPVAPPASELIGVDLHGTNI